MESLTLCNRKQQNNKRFRKSQIDYQNLSIVKYPHLIELDISSTHKDYHEEFLLDTKMCLPNHINVYMNYRFFSKAFYFYYNFDLSLYLLTNNYGNKHLMLILYILSFQLENILLFLFCYV